DNHIAVLEGDAEGQDIRIAINDVVRYGTQEYANRERGTDGVQDILSAVLPTECASAQVLRYAIMAIQDRARCAWSGRLPVRRRFSCSHQPTSRVTPHRTASFMPPMAALSLLTLPTAKAGGFLVRRQRLRHTVARGT